MPKPTSWYSIKADADTAEIQIYDEITSADQFVKDLRAIKAPIINLYLNTPGGNVFDGMAIYAAIRSLKADVYAFIEGLAASMGSIVAIACDKVHMAENAFFMIHNPLGMVLGEAGDMRKMAGELDQIRDQMARAYSKRTGKAPEDMAALMAEETWFNAEDAKAAGFVDEITDGSTIAAHFDSTKFKHAPAALLARTTTGQQDAARAAKPAEAKHKENPPMADTKKAALPTPNDGESKDDFMTRCLASDGGTEDGCQLQWDNAQAKAAAFESGYKQAKADLSAKPATIDQLREVFTAEADKAFCCDAVVGKMTLDQAKTAYIKAQADALTKTTAARDELAGKVAKLGEGQGAIGTVTTTTTAASTGTADDPQAKAEAEWAANANEEQTKFSTKERFVAIRTAEIKGQFRNLAK